MSFLLLGNQRSGTNYVLDMINQHPEIETINEPFSMHLDFFRMDEEKWTADDVDPQYLHQKLRMLSQTQKYITDLNLWLNAPYPLLRGFKETALFEKFDWLQSVVHIDKTVLIIRDPRAIVNSVMKRNMQHSFWNYKQRLSDYWGYSGSMEEHIVCAELISRRMKLLINIHENYGYPFLKLENLIDNPEGEIENLMSYLEMAVSPSQISFCTNTGKETRDYTYSNFRSRTDVVDQWKKMLTPKEVEDINTIFRNEISYFSYEV